MKLLRLLLKQSFNSWRQLTVLNRLQTLFLFAVVYFFAITRLHGFLINHPTALKIVQALAGISVYFVLSAPIIFKFRLQTHPFLQQFLYFPLNDRQSMVVLAYYAYQSWAWPLTVFLILPLSILPDFAPALISFVTIVLASFNAFTLTFFFFCNSKLKNFYLKFLLPVWTLLLLVPLRFNPTTGLILIHLLHLLPLFIFVFFLKRGRLSLEAVVSSPGAHPIRRNRKKSPAFTSSTFLQLWQKFSKEILRNPLFLKAKGLLILLLFAGLLICKNRFADHMVESFTIVAFLLIYWHYSQYFNPRFVAAEPEWFFRTLRIPFVAYFSARFLSEYLFVLVILIFYSLGLHLSSIPFVEHWQIVLFLALSALVILVTMLAFQIIFYDDPRTGGYAYHFSILFFGVLSLNYYFVGPLVTILFLGAYVYKSYRFLKG